MTHIPGDALRRYASGEPDAEPADVFWAIEAHLETCGSCREELGEVVAQHSPQTMLMLAQVKAVLAEEVRRSPRMPVRRLRVPRRLFVRAAPALLHRLGMTILVVLAAVGLDVVDGAGGRFPSLVLLLAPIMPLVAVAAAWSRGLDPAHELVVASPRAGLELVLRRTSIVLAVVIPALGVAGWIVGASPARWLLPCLAFTVGALALGEVVGLHRAATGLAIAWAAVVIGPSLILAKAPVFLAPDTFPLWAAITAAVAAVLVWRRRSYVYLKEH